MASAGFMASEVARLVCGYLHNNGCTNTKSTFLEECPPELKIREFANLVDQGILRTFDVDGLTLDDILNEFAAIKATLDSLLTSAIRPDELVMYKTDGPLRKLKILSDHWVNKAYESPKPSLNMGRGRIPSSTDTSPDLPPVCSRLSSRACKGPLAHLQKKLEMAQKGIKEPLKLHHSYLDKPEAGTSQPCVKKKRPMLVPTKKANLLTYDTNCRTVPGTSRSRTVRLRNRPSAASENPEMALEIKRALHKPNAVNLEEKIINHVIPTPSPSTPRKSSCGGSDVDNNQVFKTPSPLKATSSPSKSTAMLSSPMKSRKNALKSKVPMRKPTGDLSMPIIVGQDEKIKKALARNDEEVSKALGEPIANAINSVGNSDKIVESFMANKELMDNLLNLLDEVTASESEEADHNGKNLLDEDNVHNMNDYDQPPPSNASSRLAIDDSSMPSASNRNSPTHGLSAIGSPSSNLAPSGPSAPNEEIPIKSSNVLTGKINDVGGQAIAQVVEAFNQELEIEQRRRLSSALDSETETANTIDMDMDDDDFQTPKKSLEGPSMVAEKRLQPTTAAELSQELTPKKSLDQSIEKPEKHTTSPSEHKTLNMKLLDVTKEVSTPAKMQYASSKSDTVLSNDTLETSLVKAQTNLSASTPEHLQGRDYSSKKTAVSKGLVENLNAHHEQVETMGFIEATAIPEISKLPSAVARDSRSESPMLRRSTRQRKANTLYNTNEQTPCKKSKKMEKRPRPSSRSRMLPTLHSMVTSDTRNLQLVTPIMNEDEASVSSYLKLCCEASVVTSNTIDEAEEAGVNLDDVSLANSDLLNHWLKSGNLSFAFDNNSQTRDEQPRKTEVLREHIIEDSIESAIMSASKKTLEERELTLVAGAAREDSGSLLKSPTKMLFKTPTKTKAKTPNRDELEQELVHAAQGSSQMTADSNSGFFKTPTKLRSKSNLEQDLELSNSNSSMGMASLFKTPVKKKSPIKALKDHMSEDSIERALSAMMNSPSRGRILEEKAAMAAETLMKTPIQKLKKRSPMPSPFLLSPGTPSKDISVASISFNQELLTVTPSIVDNPNSLSLDISPNDPRTSLETPSPKSSEECLITPPSLNNDIGLASNDRYSLNGSIGAPRTPRTPRGISKAVSDLVMSSPLKALSDAAKKLFAGDGPNKTFVFLSPSKRQPRRATLMSVDTRSPLRLNSSSWEAKHDVNNLDHYQLIVKETEPTPSASRKRRLSNPGNKAKKAKIEAPAPVMFDVNMELVPQLRKTPSKIKPIERVSSSESNSLPDALGLVPNVQPRKTPEPLPKSPNTPNTRSNDRRSRAKKLEAVQRNLLDEEGFLSPIKAKKAKTKTPVKKKAILHSPAETEVAPSSATKITEETNKVVLSSAARPKKAGQSPLTLIKASTPLSTLRSSKSSEPLLKQNEKSCQQSPLKLIKSSKAPPQATSSKESFVFKTPQKQPPTASLASRKITPTKQPTFKTKKVAAASPAKVKSAFMSPSKINRSSSTVASSPAKSMKPTALLTISQPFEFFEQKPWNEDD